MTDFIEWVLRWVTASRAPVPVSGQLRGRGLPMRLAARVRAYAPTPVAVAASAQVATPPQMAVNRVRPYVVAAGARETNPCAVVDADIASLLRESGCDNSPALSALAGVGR
ncbi:hypothetical protein [Streptomonospora litoralis]|uniref:Uncharacterized protein n=1 Tax=Streptomonospora litoralis TaxID=2498135 RepID=A0A4P6Q3A5_9ACTN|nr:hypothetical protein [Streptomonospora litoralis]QBI53157.1 hypothetical protein EKD16_06800 [Streptomonospora litoralis]